MQQACDICATEYEHGAAVLMARIVDSAGGSVRRGYIERVAYSIREIVPFRPKRRQDVAAHHNVPLDVGVVFLDSLNIDGLWNVDEAGYNFRHVIRAMRNDEFPKRGAHYEIRYLIWPKGCAEPGIIRFHVRFNPR